MIKQREKWDILSSKVQLRITYLKKDELDGKIRYVPTNTHFFSVKGKNLKESFECDRKDGIDHEVEIVFERPETFKVNQVFIRADGKVVWSYIEEPNKE